jgi:hypoxanthine phosphoribosyltransferase
MRVMKADHVASDLESIVLTEEAIITRVAELAGEIERDYEGKDLVLVGVLGGAATATVDLARALERHVEITWMAVRSYGMGVRSSGSVRLLKDIDIDLTGRNVLIVDGIIDTGLTAQWVVTNITHRGAASVRMCALFRKPSAPTNAKYIGFDVPDGFIVGYGLDYAGRYRNLRDCAILAPHAIQAPS